MIAPVNVAAVRTKTGRKVHLGSSRSSRTLCGARAVAVLKKIHRDAEPCCACGMSEDMTADTIAQWLGLEVQS